MTVLVVGREVIVVRIVEIAMVVTAVAVRRGRTKVILVTVVTVLTLETVVSVETVVAVVTVLTRITVIQLLTVVIFLFSEFFYIKLWILNK